VEAAVAGVEGVREAAVAVRGEGGGRRLVAYVVLEGREGAEAEGLKGREIREAVKERLPEHMVPGAVVVLEALPVTGNGKLDRRALPEPDEARPQLEVNFVAPRSELEGRIAAIWRDSLKLERVGINDNFFDLGGHSLLLAEVHARVRQDLQREFPLVELFKYPTVSALAQFLTESAEEQPSVEELDARSEGKRDRLRKQKQTRQRVRAAERKDEEGEEDL
jgi:acyl carrier protein